MPTNNGDVTFKYGNQNSYDALVNKDNNAIYVTTDTHRIYIGNVDYTENTQMNNATKQYVDDQAGIVGERVDNIIAHNNDTEGNSELIDIRTDVDGTIHTSAGNSVRSQISDIFTNTGKWIYEFEGAARGFDIPVSVVSGDVIYFKPLSWNGDSFTSISVYGNNNGNYTVIGAVEELGFEKYITVNASYSSLRVGFNTAQVPTETCSASIKLVKLQEESLAGYAVQLKKQTAENSELCASFSEELDEQEEQITDIVTNTGKWIYSFEDIARGFNISISVSSGDVLYFKPLSWDGDSFTSISVFGNNNGNYTVIGAVTNLGDEKYITVNASYSSLRVGFDTAQIPTSTCHATVKLVNLSSEGLAGAVAALKKQTAENSERYSGLSQEVTILENKTGNIIYSVTDTVRGIDISVSASSGDTVYFKPLVWTGDTFTSIKLYGNNAGTFTELAKVTELNKGASLTLENNYQSFRVGVSTAQIPSEDVTLTTVFSVLNNISLSDTVAGTLNNIEQLENNISGIHACDIECFCPTVYAVVGNEINIYYHNIMKCDNLDNYRITFTVDGATVSGNSIRAMEDGIRITPIASQVGTHTIKFRIEQNEVVIKTFDFSLVVSAHSEKTIKAMFIGDSMTQQATYVAEAKSLVGNGMTLYGTRSTTTRTFADSTYDKVIAHEGRSGWTTSNYCNNQTGPGNVTNPFYNSGFDFSYYMSDHTDYSDLTDVFILLGTNDTQTAITTVTANLQTMIDSIHAYNSNIKVHVGLPIPPCKDRFASGSTSIWNHKNSMWNFCKAYTETMTNCTFIPYNVAVDCWYGFPRETVPVAGKLTETVERPTDYLHPTGGRYQMGDALYAEIMANS